MCVERIPGQSCSLLKDVRDVGNYVNVCGHNKPRLDKFRVMLGPLQAAKSLC